MTESTSKPGIAARQASAWRTFKDRDTWIRAFLAVHDLTCTAKIVGTRIALHHNLETGRCDPDLAALAAGTGMSDRNVRRMLRELEHSGWLLVESRGFHRSNSFELLIPNDRTQLSGLRADTVVRSEDVRPDNPGRMTGQSGYERPDTVVREEKENRKAKRKAKIESLCPRLDLGDEESRRRDHQESESDITTEFENWWQQYPKKVDKGDARRAYLAVIRKKQATSADLLAGALRYAAERNGQEPRYTKNPAKWLNAGSWANETTPPNGNGAVIDSDGNAIRQPPPWQQKASRSWADVGFAGMRRRQLVPRSPVAMAVAVLSDLSPAQMCAA
jgi:hypothetical protein